MPTLIIFVILTALALLAGCTDAKLADRNLSKSAEMFEVDRRIVFYNGITADYMLTIQGRCNIKADTKDRQLEVLCKTGPDAYKKHFLGVSDNISYIVEQIEPRTVSAGHYRVVFKPQTILPDMDIQMKDPLTPPTINRRP